MSKPKFNADFQPAHSWDTMFFGATYEAGVLTYYRRMCGYAEMMYALRGADFYLMPSRSEVCGLQAMKAARMGCVPILAPVGGMGENFELPRYE